MSKLKKDSKKSTPGITTASLPDIVFMLLFFFMVVTTMRDSEVMVKVQVPAATELQKLEKKSLISHIFIGAPQPQYAEIRGSAPRVQLNDQFADASQIPAFINDEINKVPQEKLRSQMTCAMHIDKDVKMGLITEVKTELRKTNFRKVSYLATDIGE